MTDTPPPKWEFMVKDLGGNPQKAVDALNDYGAQGWELINVLIVQESEYTAVGRMPGIGYYTFKRPIGGCDE